MGQSRPEEGTEEDTRSVYGAIFHRQPLHVALLVLLLVLVTLLSRLPGVTEGQLWGWPASTWFWAAVLTAVVHQGYVWLAWRFELHKGAFTRLLPRAGFQVFKAVFAVLGLSRLVVLPLAVANRGSLRLPGLLQWGLAVVCLLLSGYLFYSVFRYFGIDRAAGADHFHPEARTWPLVQEGIFQHTSNGMYVFGFLLLWVPGLVFESSGALIVAGFHHVYIWVHYHCTEEPDMKVIYG